MGINKIKIVITVNVFLNPPSLNHLSKGAAMAFPEAMI